MTDWNFKLPEGALLNCQIHVFQWIDGETGEFKWYVHHDSDLPLSSVLGLLELAKMEMINRTENAFGEDGDDDG